MVDGVVLLPLPAVRLHDDRFAADRLHAALRLRSFVVDEANPLAIAAANAVLDEPSPPPVVLLHGPSGVGKTHLAHALARSWQLSRSEARVVVTTGADFARAWDRPCDDDVDAEQERLARSKSPSVPWNRVALLVLDNVDDLLGKPTAQRELCVVLDALASSGGRAIITSRSNPTQDPRIAGALASRLAAGLTVPLAKLGKKGRAAVLAELALARGLALSPAAIERLAECGASSVPELAGVVLRLDMEARSEGRPLDEAFVCERVPAPKGATVSIRAITQAVAEHFGAKVSELRGPSRRKEIVAARSVAIFLAREMTDVSLEAIGRQFAGRDHATVTYNIRKVAAELSAGDGDTTRAVALIKRLLHEDR